MSKLTRRNFLKTSGAATGAALLGTASVQAGEDTSGATRQDHSVSDTKSNLVGTWTASPEMPYDEAEEGFNDETIRMIARTSVGGNSLRVRLVNTFGSDAVTFDQVTVGIREEGAAIVSDSCKNVTFGGETSITIPRGAKAYSDPVNLEIEPEQDLAVSIYAPESTGPATWHSTGLKTNYIASGDHTSDTQDDAFTTETTSYFYLEAIDVVSPDTNGAIVALGNSITDGSLSTVDENNTYPDILAERINRTPHIQKSVLNAGIGGNEILEDWPEGGESALARLDRDVLAQTGVTDVILLEGINDIGHSMQVPGKSVTAEEIIWGMKQIIARVHAKGLRIFGGTLVPYKGYTSSYEYTEEGNEKREAVNHWIRTSGAFDGVIDFEEIVRDPDDPLRFRPEYTADNLHPNDAGYRAMAEGIDLAYFTGRTEARTKSDSSASDVDSAQVEGEAISR